MDFWWASRSTFGRLHAFRTSIKASVGLEVRFDKMQAYIADMEAARQYVQAYMRGKAEELREEVDASMSKLAPIYQAHPSGAGIRRMATVRDAAFIGCMNAILPRFLTRNSATNTPTPGFFDPMLGSVLGRGSFNATSSACRYDHFLNDARGSGSYAAAMREAWGRLQVAIAGQLSDADARVMEREVEAASGSLF
eukprot:jgi/Tetstr1/424466/TSEL_014995.t1